MEHGGGGGGANAGSDSGKPTSREKTREKPQLSSLDWLGRWWYLRNAVIDGGAEEGKYYHV
jgi:hypothetical protein